jgi:hypothetical protein
MKAPSLLIKIKRWIPNCSFVLYIFYRCKPFVFLVKFTPSKVSASLAPLTVRLTGYISSNRLLLNIKFLFYLMQPVPFKHMISCVAYLRFKFAFVSSLPTNLTNTTIFYFKYPSPRTFCSFPADIHTVYLPVERTLTKVSDTSLYTLAKFHGKYN